MEQIGRAGTEIDDGMFTKKHLGPQACASCEKNLINVQGMPVDYYAWKKLPAHETNQRIARYGQGFSKILSTLKDDLSASNFNHHAASQMHDKLTNMPLPPKGNLYNNPSQELNPGH